jgi:hypothetical protein
MSVAVGRIIFYRDGGDGGREWGTETEKRARQ